MISAALRDAIRVPIRMSAPASGALIKRYFRNSIQNNVNKIDHRISGDKTWSSHNDSSTLYLSLM